MPAVFVVGRAERAAAGAGCREQGESLRVTVQKIAQARPTKLEICRERDPRTTSASRKSRAAYQHILERVLGKSFPEVTLAHLSNAVDLERSFGPIYSRGLPKRGQSGFAVLGVNGQEPQASIDAALTFGILWLEVCRTSNAGKLVVERLKLFVPAGCSTLVRERMAHLNRAAAKWELYELEERAEELRQIEVLDRGNIATRRMHCPNEAEIEERFGAPIALVRSMMAEVERGVLSAAEIAFRCHELEVARARLPDRFSRPSERFRSVPKLVFGLVLAQRVVNDGNVKDFEQTDTQRRRGAARGWASREPLLAAASGALAGVAGGQGHCGAGRHLIRDFGIRRSRRIRPPTGR